MNGLLFAGEQIVTPESLVQGQEKSIYKIDGKIHEQERDVSKYWTHENLTFALLGMENQTRDQRNMPLRVIGYDGASYRAQLNQEGKYYPVVTMVLHFDTESRWKKPKHLVECLDISAKIEKYINDYQIHVFDIPYLEEEQVKLFHSDFRIVADYFVQIRKNKEYIPSPEQIQHVDAVLKLFSVLTNDDRFIEYMDDRKGEVNSMCEVLDQAEVRGEARGKLQGIKAFIETCMELGISQEDVSTKLSDKFQISDEEIKEYLEQYWK